MLGFSSPRSTPAKYRSDKSASPASACCDQPLPVRRARMFLPSCAFQSMVHGSSQPHAGKRCYTASNILPNLMLLIWSISVTSLSVRSSFLRPKSNPWSEMHDRYAHWLKARLSRRYGEVDAEDIAQETWLRFGPSGAVKSVRHPKAFLLKIATNLAADRLGRHMRRSQLSAEISQIDGWSVTLPAQTDEVLAKQLVLSLPQPLRDVFVLSRIGGLSNVQIGERLGISPKTVEWRMTKALAHCAAQLRR